MSTKKTPLFTSTNDKGQYFEIKNGGNGAGFYLYVYNNPNERCIYDYHQDTLEMAQLQAFEDFDVPLSAWKQVE